MRVPKSWGQVSLNKYIQIVDIQSIDMDDIDRNIKILSLLSGVPENTILDMSFNDVKAELAKCSFIYKKPEPSKLFKKRRIGRRLYKINYDISKLTGGEYIDLMTWTKDPKKVTSNIHNIIAIFFKPAWLFNRKYKDGVQTAESRIETAELLLNNLCMDEVSALSGFFLTKFESLTKATAEYIIRKNEKMKKILEKKIEEEKRKVSRASGDGI